MTQPSPPKLIADDDNSTQQPLERKLVDDPSLKPDNKAEDTLRVNRGGIRVPSPNPSLLSIDDYPNVRLGRIPDHDPCHDGRLPSRSPAPPRTLKDRIRASWTANKGLALVLIAQLFGTLMNVTTRVLEIEGNNGKCLSLN